MSVPTSEAASPVDAEFIAKHQRRMSESSRGRHRRTRSSQLRLSVSSLAEGVPLEEPTEADAEAGKEIALDIQKEIPTVVQPTLTPRGERLRVMQTVLQRSTMGRRRSRSAARRSIASVVSELSSRCSEVGDDGDMSAAVRLEVPSGNKTRGASGVADDAKTVHTVETEGGTSARKVNEVFTLLEQADIMFSAFKSRLRAAGVVFTLVLATLLLATLLLALDARSSVVEDFDIVVQVNQFMAQVSMARVEQKFTLWGVMLAPSLLPIFVPSLAATSAIDKSNMSDPLVHQTVLDYHDQSQDNFDQARVVLMHDTVLHTNYEIHELNAEIEETGYFTLAAMASMAEQQLITTIAKDVAVRNELSGLMQEFNVHGNGVEMSFFDFELGHRQLEADMRSVIAGHSHLIVDRTVGQFSVLLALLVTCTTLLVLAAMLIPFVYRRMRALRTTVDASLAKSQRFLQRAAARREIDVDCMSAKEILRGAGAPLVQQKRRNSTSKHSATSEQTYTTDTSGSTGSDAVVGAHQSAEVRSHIRSLRRAARRRNNVLSALLAVLVIGSIAAVFANTLIMASLRRRTVRFRDSNLGILDAAAGLQALHHDVVRSIQLFVQGRKDPLFGAILDPSSPAVFTDSADGAFMSDFDAIDALWQANREAAFVVDTTSSVLLEQEIKTLMVDARTIAQAWDRAYTVSRDGSGTDTSTFLNDADAILQSDDWLDVNDKFTEYLEQFAVSTYKELEANKTKTRNGAAQVVASTSILLAALFGLGALILFVESRKRQSERLLWNASSWSLERVLADAEARELFRDFARERYSEESVLFLNAFASMHPKVNGLTARQALALAREFVWKGASNQLNLPAQLVENLLSTVPGWRTVSQATTSVADAAEADRILSIIEDMSVGDRCLALFFDVQRTCQRLLSTNILPEFLRSDLFADFTAERRRQMETQWALVSKYASQGKAPLRIVQNGDVTLDFM